MSDINPDFRSDSHLLDAHVLSITTYHNLPCNRRALPYGPPILVLLLFAAAFGPWMSGRLALSHAGLQHQNLPTTPHSDAGADGSFPDGGGVR